MRNRRSRLTKRPTKGTAALWLARRVEWMRQNPMMWTKSKKEIVDAMKKAGLIAPSTYHGDVKLKTYIELACAQENRA